MSDRIKLTVKDEMAQVRLDRPDKRNALDLEMFKAIAAVQKRLRRSHELKAVVLSGAGIDFCSGLDVKSAMHDRRGMVRLLWKWLPWQANLAQRVSVGWRELRTPVIAAIQGRCWGGGLQIALGADFRVAAPDASLSIMESKWGLIPDMGGTLALRELLGRDQAMKLAMTAEEISGERAFELGLVSALSDDPLAAAEAFAAQLAERPTDAVQGVKRLYRKSWSGSSGAALARETAYQVRILARRA
ncbi:MAG: crotonase/enoyl-CoA hydratase family protein [Xanthomonadales bacterium]|jgi:enoyl-CoA hydratase/carnithine racemase|nr:crotonase/enoyl-CoA hydratase family protein [Xanthomonadales bacterium]